MREVAGVTGLEPAASGVTGRRSNQLSYTPYRAVKPRPEAIFSMYGLGFTKSRQAVGAEFPIARPGGGR